MWQPDAGGDQSGTSLESVGFVSEHRQPDDWCGRGSPRRPRTLPRTRLHTWEFGMTFSQQPSSTTTLNELQQSGLTYNSVARRPRRARTTHTFTRRTGCAGHAAHSPPARSLRSRLPGSTKRGQSVCSALGRVAFSSVCCLVVVVDDVDVGWTSWSDPFPTDEGQGMTSSS